ncbi:L-aminoadipate-semialdehyde dehydrogenase-phosphopantetheinyl transferase [Madurella mycetomatis]|uniref:holo-[acyl-carrier-protein] synthase n=1 Tax=Madurella mycetomatis TaxID=100816 RepID=A0A175W9E4_9PEZI|nr:L-aminoadipate-semialdehyde dehydrogenase-phosphopantetheinyl transferase [Madurella mycetomatis]
MSSKPTLVQWILDTRHWFPEATETKHLETHAQASRALALLPQAERTSVLRYFHVRDAKMSLASCLLKHYCITRLAPGSPPWDSTTITRDARTKPVWIDPATGTQPVSFNVSHQAGIVALVAVANYRVGGGGEVAAAAAEVGVDVVCTSERRARDQKIVREEGWPAFVDMHADVFGPGEVRYLKYQVLSAMPPLDPAPSAEQLADAKLRAFYALWALREAYIKLTGEALLAEWLRELEFRDFHPPKPTAGWEVPADEDIIGREAQVIRQAEIRLRGRKIDDVNMCLRSVGQDFMIATAVRTPGNKDDGLGWRLGPYEILSLEEVLDYAESR